jgi:hypothetical protein
MDAYQIALPSIRVFRRGIMGDYRGPVDSSDGMASYVMEDAKVRDRNLLLQHRMS